MIPIRDDQPRFITPYVTYFLIGLNLVIFLFEASLDPQSFKALLLFSWGWCRPTSRLPSPETATEGWWRLFFQP